eukprot:3085325-Rhodomonas_salina.1
MYTDHESLKYIQTQPTETLSPRLTRWQEYLSQYNFSNILHMKGKDNVVADTLSRRPDLAPLLDALCMPLEITLGSLTSPTSSTLTDIIHAQKLDPFCVKITSLIKRSPNPKDPIHRSGDKTQSVSQSHNRWDSDSHQREL